MSSRDLGASVRQRLLNRSRSENRPFQELLQYFAMERFLYRLSQSNFADRFVLKGALLVTAWRAPMSRPTIDIDLAGRTSNELDHIRALLVEVCTAKTEPDGVEFAANSVRVSRIREDADYEGVRGQFHATVAKARTPMRVDIGFGDVITPEPAEVDYPTLLDFPAPILMGYPRETVVSGEARGARDARTPEQQTEGLLRHRSSGQNLSVQRHGSGQGDRRDLSTAGNRDRFEAGGSERRLRVGSCEADSMASVPSTESIP